MVNGVPMATSRGNETVTMHTSRTLLIEDHVCDKGASSNAGYQKYFEAMDNIYTKQSSKVFTLGSATTSLTSKTCITQHKECGWVQSQKKELPLFVISVGLEGAGHHLWTEILDAPVFDCVWINARHYKRTVGDGMPRTTTNDFITRSKQGRWDFEPRT